MVKSKNNSVISIYVNYIDFKDLRIKIESPFELTPKFNRVFNNPIGFL